MRIVALVGLGMNPRAVSNISDRFQIEVAPTLDHHKHETLKSYARRWADELRLNSDDVVIGFSFAGPVALEMAQYKRIKGCILISTFADPKELPEFQRRALNLGLHKWIPYSLGWKLGEWWAKKKGVIHGENKKAVAAIQRATRPQFYRWVLEGLKNWEGTQPSCSVLRLHGTDDHIIPIASNTTDTFFIEGNHFLLSSREALKAIQERVDLFLSRLAS